VRTITPAVRRGMLDDRLVRSPRAGSDDIGLANELAC
jgi:hypothetical protein